MNNPKDYRHFDFQSKPRRLPGQLLVTLGVVVIFCLLWWLIPPMLLFWLLLLPVAGIAWIASYGFSKAANQLIKWLQQLANL